MDASRHSVSLLLPPATAPLGVRGEALAALHLEEHDGLEVMARNWRLTAGALRGELDLVALDHRGAAVVVCEVKTRPGERFGGPLAAVTPRKQRRIRRLSAAFLTQAALPYRRVRFDVVAIRLPAGPGRARLTHLPEAF